MAFVSREILLSLARDSKLPFLDVGCAFLFYMFSRNFSSAPARAPARHEETMHVIPFLSVLLAPFQSLSQNIQTSDGIHSQHKQMNILQTITSNGGALQVIQAQTVQKSSSRRAITSTTFSSSSSSQFTSGFGAGGSFSSGHPMSSDLLVS
jgi:hypothetical protein